MKELYPLAYDDSGTSEEFAHRISKLCRNILESRVSVCDFLCRSLSIYLYQLI